MVGEDNEHFFNELTNYLIPIPESLKNSSPAQIRDTNGISWNGIKAKRNFTFSSALIYKLFLDSELLLDR